MNQEAGRPGPEVEKPGPGPVRATRTRRRAAV